MQINRQFSSADVPVIEQVKWKTVESVIKDHKTGKIIFHMPNVEVPEQWSDNAANILAQKYFRKAGVPKETITINSTDVGKSRIDKWHVKRGLWNWLWPRVPLHGTEFGPETSAKQVFHRLAGCWTYWGWRSGLFREEKDAQAFYDECFMMLALQIGAPNSPQWFNTGLHWAYGIEGPESGQWAVVELHGDRSDAPEFDDQLPGGLGLKELRNAYERPQPHACFIQPVKDDLVNPGGIMDLWVREVRLFKHGSGTGSNFSTLRGKGESLSGGGVSSGLMSFLRIGDQSAGSIASGGITRRAAKMVILDLDHPEIEEFINWKVEEEYKAACMATGSRLIREAKERGTNSWYLINKQVYERVEHGFPVPELDEGWEGPAISSVSGQNSNNSVRVPDAFIELLDIPEAVTWNLKARTTGKTVKSLNPKHLWEQICRAAWASADPGVQFHDTINVWHTCPDDGQINASNPCSEYMFLDNTACNLASLNLVSFPEIARNDQHIDLFTHAVRLWTIVLDISVSMASFPSQEIALGSYNYRTLGLGYANLGGLLMRNAIAYASGEARALAAAITALMTGVAYHTSAEMAAELGAFPRWSANQDAMRRVLNKHKDACQDIRTGIKNWRTSEFDICGNMVIRAILVWEEVVAAESFRNAQTTLIAPTGTIAFVMDCDTTGIEPDFALVKSKNLAGGGTMRIVNQGIDPALYRMGFPKVDREALIEYIDQHGCLPKNSALDLRHAAQVLACANEIDAMAHVGMVAAVQPFLSGAVSKTINLPADATVEDVDQVYRAAHRLGLKAVSLYRDGSKLTQPLSVANESVSPTVPSAASEPSWQKVPQIQNEPLDQTAPIVPSEPAPMTVPHTGSEPSDWKSLSASSEPRLEIELRKKSEPHAMTVPQDGSEPHNRKVSFGASELPRGAQEYLPWRRNGGYRQKAKLGDQTLWWSVSEYEDGRPGEIFIDLAYEGSTLRAMANCVAISMSVALQHGTPLEQLVDKFLHTKFEPAGTVEGHDRIKFASSIADLIAKDMAITYLGREDLAHVVRTVEPLRMVAGGAMTSASLTTRTGDVCPRCGTVLVRTGTCLTCPGCDYNTGCS